MMRGKMKEKKVGTKAAIVLAALACAGACLVSLGINQALNGSAGGTEELSEAEAESSAGEESDDSSVWSGEEEDPVAGTEASVTITNTDTYVFSDDITDLLNERLAGYLTEEGLASVSSAEIISVLIPETDVECTCYYTALTDSAGGESICLLSYHEREQVVTASAVSYTREEVLEEAWDDNGPAERDVSEEDDTTSASGTVE